MVHLRFKVEHLKRTQMVLIMSSMQCKWRLLSMHVEDTVVSAWLGGLCVEVLLGSM